MTVGRKITEQLSKGSLSCRRLHELLRPGVAYRKLSRTLWEMERQGAVKALLVSACEALNTYRNALSEAEQQEFENIVRWQASRRAGHESLPHVYLFFLNNACPRLCNTQAALCGGWGCDENLRIFGSTH